MVPVGLLPRIFRWIFMVLAALFAAAALIMGVLILVDALVGLHLPPGVHWGPADIDIAGQPGTVALRAVDGDSDFLATAFGGTITLAVQKAGGLIEVAKHYGLPLVLMKLIFLAALFELLRRLFRNVGRGESFTLDTIRLVQGIGLLLIVFSFLSAFAEGQFRFAFFNYVARHAVITVSGTPVHFPPPRYELFPSDGGFPDPLFGDGGFPFGSPFFFSGLLVLALSEVFRQGLALKDENALTI